MAQFYSVNKDVLPLKANLAVMQGKYQGAKKELDAAEALLAAKEVRLCLQINIFFRNPSHHKYNYSNAKE